MLIGLIEIYMGRAHYLLITIHASRLFSAKPINCMKMLFAPLNFTQLRTIGSLIANACKSSAKLSLTTTVIVLNNF